MKTDPNMEIAARMRIATRVLSSQTSTIYQETQTFDMQQIFKVFHYILAHYKTGVSYKASYVI
jgi:hypothetical protein